MPTTSSRSVAIDVWSLPFVDVNTEVTTDNIESMHPVEGFEDLYK